MEGGGGSRSKYFISGEFFYHRIFLICFSIGTLLTEILKNTKYPENRQNIGNTGVVFGQEGKTYQKYPVTKKLPGNEVFRTRSAPLQFLASNFEKQKS